MKTIKTILIDDEELARQELRYMLQLYSDIEIIAEAENVTDALEKVRLLKPDLIFLDISMPGKTGFDLLNMLDESPAVVFVTAFDEFAIQAFDANALDYILKPVRKERLDQAISNIKKEFETQTTTPPGTALNLQSRIFIKDGEKCFFVKLEEVFLIENAGNYARFHFRKNAPMVHKSMNYLEETLPPATFFRANRSEIININYIRDIESMFKGALNVILENSRKIEISTRQSVKFKELMSI
jgi:two-component system, LytTR family, response regulator